MWLKYTLRNTIKTHTVKYTHQLWRGYCVCRWDRCIRDSAVPSNSGNSCESEGGCHDHEEVCTIYSTLYLCYNDTVYSGYIYAVIAQSSMNWRIALYSTIGVVGQLYFYVCEFAWLFVCVCVCVCSSMHVWVCVHLCVCVCVGPCKCMSSRVVLVARESSCSFDQSIGWNVETYFSI
jgi:hypothetical protein